jgi:hypothetical protein
MMVLGEGQSAKRCRPAVVAVSADRFQVGRSVGVAASFNPAERRWIAGIFVILYRADFANSKRITLTNNSVVQGRR